MKDLLNKINRVFENRVRLAVMGLLVVNESMDFNQLKEILQLTDGNLATHISTLEKAGYLNITKGFAGKKTLTTYRATENGRSAFKEHLEVLEQLLRSTESKEKPEV